jgi:putative ABC transport system permease protein
MSAALLQAQPRQGSTDEGVTGRRAVIRWGWRLLRREWRQQLLVLGLLSAAVAATIFGAAVATNTPPANPDASTFGTAGALISLPASDPHLAADIALIQSKWGPADVIEDENLTTGTVQSVQLRAENPRGLYNSPMLALVSGSYPAGPSQVAMTSQVASLYGVHVGGSWTGAGRTWRVTGIVSNPGDLLDEFVLTAPGQVSAPSQVIMLIGSSAVQQADASAGVLPARAGAPAQGNPHGLTGLPAAAAVSYPTGASSGISPATIVVAVALVGLVFIGLVSVAGFTVMAQRRLRALGMLSAIGATERQVRLVMVANGAAVGVVAVLIGAAAGFVAWFSYAPSLQSDTGHVINEMNLPWWAITMGILLAIVTSTAAAARPARTVARIPVIAALSGRPVAPRAAHRAALPGSTLVAGGLACLVFSGGWGGHSIPDTLLLLAGLVALIIGMLLLTPLSIQLRAAGAGPRVPVSVRIALRDLLRYRARSGAALAAVTFAVFLAMLIGITASVRFSKILDWTGQNLTASQLIIYTKNPSTDIGPSAGPTLTQAQLNDLGKQLSGLAGELHARSVLALETTSATLNQAGTGSNNFSGTVYVATPQLLTAYGIKPSQIDAGTYILTMRPGMAGLSGMQLLWGAAAQIGGPGVTRGNYCSSGDCLANPKMQTVSSLPSGTSAPNTVITEYAVDKLGLRPAMNGWLIQTPAPLTPTQIDAARQLALSYGVWIETKSGELALSQIADGATALGVILALGVLAMTVGLIRSETARDLRTLTATGASAITRRTITAATAGGLGLLGTLLGAATATAAGLAWAHASLSVTFGDIPLADILILLAGLPLAAAVGGWLLAGREPATISRQPLE